MAIVVPETDWTADLLGCCGDCSTCFMGFFCCPCGACNTSSQMGHAKCLPLLDICGPSVMSGMTGIPLCASPALLSLRVSMRHEYNIRGSLCNDIFASCCCVCCAYCQLAHEIKFRKRNPGVTVVTVKQPTSTSYVSPN